MRGENLSSPPLKRNLKVCVAIPASIVSDMPHQREKTLKVGLIGRALAIFRIDEVIIYPDIIGVDQSKDLRFVAMILSYMETPQYLRKRLFKIEPELRYAGILPPLRTPHHPIKNRKKYLRVGEFREGIVVSKDKMGLLIDIGVEQPIRVVNAGAPIGARVTIKVISCGDDLRAVLASPEDIDVYWGYKVEVSRMPFSRMVKSGNFDVAIATSKWGEPFMKVKDVLLEKWMKSKRVLVAFGSPTQGLQEIARQEGIELSDIMDFIINTVPRQATETVRTEEALYATLAILNLLTEA